MPIKESNLEGLFTFEDAGGAQSPLPDELPFHVLFVGDWSGDAVEKELAERKPVLIDRDNFDEVMERLGVVLKLGIGSEEVCIEFREIDDFHPDSLFRNLPVFGELRELRRRLRVPDEFAEAAAEVRSWFGGDVDCERNENPATTVSIDELIAGSEVRSREESDLSKLIAQVVEPYLVKIDEQEQGKLVAAVDAAITALMRAILHHPRFLALESGWRGLLFAVRRVATDRNLKLFVIDLSKQECADNLKSVNSLADSVLSLAVIPERLELMGADPFSVICADYSFGLTIDDAAMLMRLGRIAAAAGAPLISYVRPEMFGLTNLAGLPGISALRIDEDGDAGKLWNAIRSVPEAASIGLVPMRFLARVPYGAASDPVETFVFEEFTGTPEHEKLCWANPAFACAVLLAASFSRLGWKMGDGLAQDLDRFSLYYFLDREDTRQLMPIAECFLSESAAGTFVESGLMPLATIKDTDRIKLIRYRSVHQTTAALSGRWLR